MTMRTAKPTDFFVAVDGIGRFRYGRRTFGDRLKIRSEFLRLVGELDGENMDADLAGMASIVAAHNVLCVEAPAGWANLEQLDLLEDADAEDKIYRLYGELRSKEDSFRRPNGAGAGGEEAGQGDGANDGVLVPSEVQPATA
jgi:hypothetical protein